MDHFKRLECDRIDWYDKIRTLIVWKIENREFSDIGAELKKSSSILQFNRINYILVRLFGIYE